MNAPASAASSADIHAIASRLAQQFAETAAERDRQGGTPKRERDALRASGLLRLTIPVDLGGMGAGWQQTLSVVRQFARVDSSAAHVFGFHHLLLATTRLFGREEQWRPWLEQTAQHRWFWGNALNPLDTRTVAYASEDGYRFSGKKSFCSGALDSDMLLASALEEGTSKLLIAVVPTARAGIRVADDWDNMGQRQTDSGSAEFTDLRVHAGEVLSHPGPLSSPYACLRPLIAQLILVNVYIGLAEGALEHARRFTLEQSRVWPASLATRANQDPYTLLHYGQFQAGLEAARLLGDRAARLLDEALQQGLALTEQGRGEVALAVASAKVTAAQVGLDLTSRMFDVTGARATTAALRLDRFWRNLRVHTLHDPLDYKLRELGDWAL
ncbi:MAG: acyl-CoA dehydrogenase family protein, partial [Gammaproteobacteria bacterium]